MSAASDAVRFAYGKLPIGVRSRCSGAESTTPRHKLAATANTADSSAVMPTCAACGSVRTAFVVGSWPILVRAVAVRAPPGGQPLTDHGLNLDGYGDCRLSG